MTRWRIERHPLVERDVRRIILHLLEHTSQNRVAEIIAQIEQDIEALRENPHRGTRRDEIVKGLRAVPTAKRGVIAFQILEDHNTMRLLAIAWGGGDWLNWLRNRSELV